MPFLHIERYVAKKHRESIRQLLEKIGWAAQYVDAGLLTLDTLDAQPLNAAQLAQARPVPRVKTLRRTLRMTQEEFATRFRLSLATVRDWEQGRTKPDQAASAYLEVIARLPQAVMQALGTAPDQVAPTD